jgi:PAS domain S-box-containing protein
VRGRSVPAGVIGTTVLVVALVASTPVWGVDEQGLQTTSGGVDQTSVIVVLHSYHHGYSWTDNISAGIRDGFAERDQPVQLRFEFLDSRRMVSDDYFEDLRRLLETKYSEIGIDVVICADDQALHFLLGPGAEIFREVPAVVCSASSFEPAMRELRAITGLEDSFDFRETLDLALGLHAGIREVVVIADTSRTGTALADRAKDVFGSHGGGLRFRYLENLTLDELLSETAALDDGSLIFFLTFSQDDEGGVFPHDLALRRIRHVSRAPIYAVWESFLGLGIVGGKIHSGREEGRMVAEMAHRIIRGERASEMPMVSSPSRFRFDWRELDRFGIDESRLPPGSLISQRPFSLYREYRRMFWAIGVTFAVLVTMVVFLVINTLRRRRAEAVQARFAAILASTSDFVATATPEGEITYLNLAGRRLIGWREDEPLDGKRIRDIQPKWVLQLIREQAGPDSTREGIWEGETAVIAKDGGEIPVSQVILAHRSAAGEIDFFSTIIRDLRSRIETEETLRAIEEHLEHSRKMEAIGQLAGGVAHDFNNILMGIMGNAELLAVLLPEGSKEAERAREILGASEKAAAVTRQLLTFSRKGSFTTELVDLREVVRSVINLISRSIDRRIEVDYRAMDEPAAVMADPSQIENAILNLAVNARDAMPDGGHLVVTVGRTVIDPESLEALSDELVAGDYVEVTVRDTGIGIPEDLQDRIFDPFFTTKGPGQGTGLGLATAYGCVRNHKGRITVSSEPGLGSEFRVVLPMCDAASDAGAESFEQPELEAGEGHLMVVDDESMVREILRESLQSLGYRVTTCRDGAEALERYRSEGAEIDLVVLDLIMPKLNGADVFRELRKVNPGVRVLLSSGFSPDAESQQLIEEGALGFLVKPFTLGELAETVRHALGTDSQ